MAVIGYADAAIFNCNVNEDNNAVSLDIANRGYDILSSMKLTVYEGASDDTLVYSQILDDLAPGEFTEFTFPVPKGGKGEIMYTVKIFSDTEEMDYCNNEMIFTVTKRFNLSGISNQIATGKKIKLAANPIPADSPLPQLIWSSSNPKVATVIQTGVVTLKKNTGGKTVIITATAADGSGISASWKIKSMKGVVKKVKITVMATDGSNKKKTVTIKIK